MKRRSYLAVACVAVTSGCAGVLPSSDERQFDPESTFETVEIGSEDDIDGTSEIMPHGLVVWNAAATSQNVVVQVRTQSDDDAYLLNEVYNIPADAAVEVRLHSPDDYVVVVHSLATDIDATVSVSERQFDCNASRHEITVPESGRITSTVTSTLVAC